MLIATFFLRFCDGVKIQNAQYILHPHDWGSFVYDLDKVHLFLTDSESAVKGALKSTMMIKVCFSICFKLLYNYDHLIMPCYVLRLDFICVHAQFPLKEVPAKPARKKITIYGNYF